MVAPSNIASAIRRFICAELAPDLDGADLEDDASLLDSGILDSFGIMSLLEFIRLEFGVDIPAEDIEPDKFETIAAIAQTVSTHLQELAERTAPHSGCPARTVIMDFSLDSQQEQLRDTIVRFAKKELNDDLIERDRAAGFPHAHWRRCAALDLCALPFPEQYGGCGFDLLSTVIAVEALSYACHDAGLVHALLTQLVSGQALQIFATPELRQRHLPSICSGDKIVAQAATEADAGSDVFSMRTRAVREDETWVIDGAKMFVSNGPVADLILVLAVTNPKRKGFGAHSMLLVERERPGFSSGSAFSKMGLRSLQNSELVFDGCRVPAQNLVGKEGQGSIIFTEVMEWERIVFGACHVGTLSRIVEQCTAYARQRKQFGQAIGKYQAVSGKIARMKMNLELARLMVHKAAALKDQGRRAPLEAATVKIFASESLRNAALDAVQIHGAMGYMTETQIERELRDSVASTIYSGTVELNSVIISKLLGL